MVLLGVWYCGYTVYDNLIEEWLYLFAQSGQLYCS